MATIPEQDLARTQLGFERLSAAMARSLLELERARVNALLAAELLVQARQLRAAVRILVTQLYPDSCPPRTNDSAATAGDGDVSACRRQNSQRIREVIRKATG